LVALRSLLNNTFSVLKVRKLDNFHIIALSICLSLFGFPALSGAQGSDDKQLEIDPAGSVFHIKIDGMIDKALASYIHRAINEAEAQGASLIVFEIDTFGGEVDAADRIRKSLLNADVAQSYMRGLMRATAEAKGRNPQVAEAMVDENLEVPGISEQGQVLTLSASEALETGIADAIFADKEEAIRDLGLDTNSVVVHEPTRLDRLFRFFGSPVVQSILMMMMLSGLYFELQSPGIGFAGLMSALGALLFFAPNYMVGLVESWEIVLFFVGVLLLAAEIFVIPGFGVAGIAGLVLVITSLFAGLIGNSGLDMPSTMEMNSAILTLCITLVLAGFLMFSLSKYLPETKAFNRLVLSPELNSADGYISNETDFDLMSKVGVTLTDLRPSGTVMVGDKRVDVISEGAYVPKNAQVRVVEVNGNRVLVREVKELSA